MGARLAVPDGERPQEKEPKDPFKHRQQQVNVGRQL
jgi:hypothetical protein